MAAFEKVILTQEPWAPAFRPLLARASGGPWGERAIEGLIGAIDRREALLMVARADGAALGIAVISFQKWPLPLLYVHAMAVVPGTGFEWGKAFLPQLETLAAKAGAVGVRAEVSDAANERWLRSIGFVPEFKTMVAPCAG